MIRHFLAAVLFSQVAVVSITFAQEEGSDSISETESLYEQEIKKKNTIEQPSAPVSEPAAEESQRIKNISDLESLAPFDDIAVIQKRYLPKTNRFEFFPNIGLVTNNAFFFNGLAQVRLGYAFSEQWALEAMYAVFFDREYDVTKDLKKDPLRVSTASLILPDSYYGLDVRWTPIYGKMGFFNKNIIPFDMYFSLGGGVTDTNQNTNPFTVHVGTGQIFALKKWWAFRWDLSMYFYESEAKLRTTGGQDLVRSDSFNDIELTVGMSFFFPEASYR